MASGVQRMTHPVVDAGDDLGNSLGSKIEFRGAARGLLFYLAPTIIFFVVAAIGLWPSRLPGDFWGMYGNDDGIWAAWNLRGIFEWSRPFDLAPFNPLSGMGSTFLPNTPWLNPAALALALPLPREVSYLISYFVYFVELSLVACSTFSCRLRSAARSNHMRPALSADLIFADQWRLRYPPNGTRWRR